MSRLAVLFRLTLVLLFVCITSALAGQNFARFKMGGFNQLPDPMPEEKIRVDVTKTFVVHLRWRVNYWHADMRGHVLKRIELDQAGKEVGESCRIGPDVIRPDFSDDFLSQAGLEDIKRMKAAGELTNPTTEEAIRQFCEPLAFYKINMVASRLFPWARVFGLGIVDTQALPGKKYEYRLYRVFLRQGESFVEPKPVLIKRVTVQYPVHPAPMLQSFTARRSKSRSSSVKLNWAIPMKWIAEHGESRALLLYAFTKEDGRCEVLEQLDWGLGTKSEDGLLYKYYAFHSEAPLTPIRYAIALVNHFDRPSLPSVSTAVAAAPEPAMGIEQVKLVRRDGGILVTWSTGQKKKPRGFKGFRVLRGSSEEYLGRPDLCLTEELLPWDQKWFFDKSFDANKEAGRYVTYEVRIEAAKVEGFREEITHPLKIPYPDPTPPRDLKATTEIRNGKPWAVVKWQPVEFPGAKATRIRYMEHAVGEWKEGALVEKGTSCEFALDTDPDGGLVVFSAHGVNVKYMEGKLDTRVRLTVPPYGELAPAAYTKTGQVADHLHLEWKYPMKEYLTGFRLLDGAKVIRDEKTLGPFERQADLYGLAPGTHTLSLVAVDRHGRVSAPTRADVIMRPLRAAGKQE